MEDHVDAVKSEPAEGAEEVLKASDISRTIELLETEIDSNN